MKEKLNISTNLALLLLGVFCQTEMLRRTLGFSVQPHFYYCLILLCIGLWYTAHGRRLNGIGILASLLILFLVFRIGRSDILPQLTDFFGRIGNLVSERFLLNADSYPYSPEASGYSLLFLTLAFLEAAYLSIALSSRGARTDLRHRAGGAGRRKAPRSRAGFRRAGGEPSARGGSAPGDHGRLRAAVPDRREIPG